MNTTPIIICAMQRSGTTVLQFSLSSLPYFNNYGEIFHHLRKNDKVSFFKFRDWFISNSNINPAYPLNSTEQKDLFTAYLKYICDLSDSSSCILDIKYNSWHHFNPVWHNPTSKPHLLNLIQDRKIPIIHLVRKNVFAQYISAIFAIKAKQYHFKTDEERAKRAVKVSFKINPTHCLKEMQISEKTTLQFDTWFEDNDKVLKCYYEEMFDDTSEFNKEFISSIIDHLNLRSKVVPEDIQVKLVKSIRDYNSIIKNKEEVIEFFTGTHYEQYVNSVFT